jgi:hypothetical protein
MMLLRTLLLLFLLLLLTGTVGSTAWAREGRLEINQACVSSGCFPGDSAGFPVTVTSTTGVTSIVLTGDLEVTDPSQTAISLVVEHATLDLNGFTIAGPVTCTGSGSTRTCDPGAGVAVISFADRVTVRNGAVTGFGGGGLRLGRGAHVEDVIAASNGGNGIETGDRATIEGAKSIGNAGFGIESNGVITDCAVAGNGSNGIRPPSGTFSVPSVVKSCSVTENGGVGINCNGSSCTIVDNVVRSNESSGIVAGAASTVRGNAVYGNGGTGILSNFGALISGNSVQLSTGDGIQCLAACTVIGNHVIDNDVNGIAAAGSVIQNNTVQENEGVGIQGIGSAVRGNVSSNNAGFGLSGDPETGYVGNVMNGNNPAGGALSGPQVDGSPSVMGTNVCSGSPFCP